MAKFHAVAAIVGAGAVLTYAATTVNSTEAVVNTPLDTLYKYAEELNTMNFLMPYWAYMLENYSDFTIFAGFTFVLHEIVFFGGWLPYLILDFIPYFHKYKIQESKPNTWEETWRCIKSLMFNHIFVQLPMIISSDYNLKMLGFGMAAPLPTA